MNEKEIYINGIGNVKILKSQRSSRLSISVKPFKGVQVSIPFRSSFAEGERFLFEKADWLRKSIEKVKKIEGNTTFFDTNTTFCTIQRCAKIIITDFEKIKFRVTHSEIIIECPAFVNFRDNKVQNHIKNGLIEIMRWEAKQYLPHRTKLLAERNGFKFKEVFIKNASTRWGSCTFDNKINLNLHLMRLPQYLCDHIILHELVHTVHKNHGKGFWNLLEQVDPFTKKYQKELKDFKLSVF